MIQHLHITDVAGDARKESVGDRIRGTDSHLYLFRRKNMNSKLLIAAAALVAVPAFAATVDGTLDGSYGAARAVQTVETGFGDNQS
jgi:hypothetical protein